jgi:hypothetical protein
MKGIEESHFTSFYISFCWLYIFIEEDNLLYAIVFARDWIEPTWRVILLMWTTAYFWHYTLFRSCITWIFYTIMHWFYYWFYIKWITHHVAIITTIPSTHHRSTNTTVYANSTSKLDKFLMVDTDVTWFNKQGNCGIILETWILLWGAFFDLLRGGFMKEVLNWVPYIEHDLDRLDSLLYMY